MLTRILLIEDNPGDALIFREKLNASDLEYELVHTQRLQEGLDLLAEDSFDILLCDLSLPDARGLEAVVKVRRAAPDRPLIVLTGLDDATAAAQAKSEGAVDYLVKWYVDSVSLARYIRYAIAQYGAELPVRDSSAAVAVEGQRVASPVPAPADDDPPPPDALVDALEAAADGLAVVGEGRRVLYANEQARTWIGEQERYPWPVEAGTRQVHAHGDVLEQRAARTTWGGSEAFMITLLTPPPPEPRRGAAAGPLLQAAEAALAFVEHTSRQTQWMSDVMRAALDLPRREADGHKPQPELVDLAEIAQQVGRELRSEALQRGTPLRVQAHRKKVVAYADRVLAGQAIRRLVLDALHVAHPGKGVDVDVEVDGDHSTVEVAWGSLRSDPSTTAAVVQELAGAVSDALVRQLGGRLERRGDTDRTIAVVTLPCREDVRV